jgi:cephalosporin-C deacetylase-like acetyl esterase
MGHGPWGKAEAFGFASNLARDGIAVLAYDPLGAGERLQAMNPATGKSWAGPDEHSQAQIPISLIGDHVSRYMIWDAMRGIDYLGTRPEIDSKNIGSFGCSGGGTLSAYLTALDERVKAGVVACYLTSYETLLKTIGPQDGEQVIPDFIKDGLDFPDLIELAAPRAYAMVSTSEDMFPFDGARASYDEAERFYSLLAAGDNLQWLTGPGGHGAIRPLAPKIVSFFHHSLLHSDSPPPQPVTLQPPSRELLQCTSTGQVTTALQGRTIYQINRERVRQATPSKTPISLSAELHTLQQRLRQEIPAATGMDATAQALPVITVTQTEQRSGYRLETAIFHSRTGMQLPAKIALPEVRGQSPALLMTSSQTIETLTAAGSDFDRAAQAAKVVLAITPLPWPPSPDAMRPTMGTMLPWISRAFLVGKTFVGMRAEDVLAATEWLATQPEVDSRQIIAYGEGASGVVLLHAAALDQRIRDITIEHTLISYASVVAADVHRNVAESVVPGVLMHYDFDDLMIAIAPRRIHVLNPVDGSGDSLTEAAFFQKTTRVRAADQTLQLRDRVTFATRASGDPLPDPRASRAQALKTSQ